ncbi:lysophospholipid acyltransferase family protein [Fulvivirgaceae bacterium BMA12]|uniref:Lysophospholipid acyltransferase family protein n=1 Tax=Agaribacillus aureus TaxID=3051825 RepID=A0ABT8LM95_9BACT|nr:lysophospholipid acyltransferase family protein [Fulvivirgaceae bacterium BMA12]
MVFLKLLSRIPLNILYVLSNLVYFITFYIAGYRKKTVYTNLRNAFPEKSDQEIRDIAKAFYKRFSDFAVEVLKGITISAEALNSRVKFTNVEILEPFRSKNQSVVVLASHQFNWEWGLLAGCLQLPFPIDAVYQRLSNKAFDQLMLDTRSRFGGNPIEKNSALLEIMRQKDRLKALGIVADQSPTQDAPKHWTNFLNQPTAFYLGAQQISRLAGYPAFFMHIKYISRGKYEVKLINIGLPPYEKGSFNIIENYARETEKAIARDPAGWLWSHQRWKLERPADS